MMRSTEARRKVWTVELLVALSLFLTVVLLLERTLPAAREAAEAFGLAVNIGVACLGQPAWVC